MMEESGLLERELPKQRNKCAIGGYCGETATN